MVKTPKYWIKNTLYSTITSDKALWDVGEKHKRKHSNTNNNKEEI